MTSKTILGNSVGFSIISFASYFDVYSHRYWFVGVDPWYNPAHILLYTGVLVLTLTVISSRHELTAATRLEGVGLVVVLLAAASNEVWHRVLLFGNPVPEPFPVEPPHALLAVGFAICGVGALVGPLEGGRASDIRSSIALSMTSGSLWLVVAGSFFYLGAAYAASWSYFLAVMMGTFSAVLFLRCPAGASGRFGSATLAYLWYLGVNYLFFVGPEGYPAGLLVVVPYDLIISKRLGRYSPAFVTGIASLFLAMLYGIVYFPLLPLSDALAFNPYLIASFLGLGLETAVELLWSRGRVRDSGLENVN